MRRLFIPTLFVVLLASLLAAGVLRLVLRDRSEGERRTVIELAERQIELIDRLLEERLANTFDLSTLALAAGPDSESGAEGGKRPGALVILPVDRPARVVHSCLAPEQTAALVSRLEAELSKEGPPSSPWRMTLLEPLLLERSVQLVCGAVALGGLTADDGVRWQHLANCIELRDLIEESRIDLLAQAGYDFVLAALGDVGELELARSSELTLTRPVERMTSLPGSRWRLELVPRNGWLTWRTMAPEIIAAALFVLLACTVTHDMRRRSRLLDQRVSDRNQRLGEMRRQLDEQIAQRLEYESRLERDSLYDSLTRLPNRELLMLHLKRSLRRARWRDEKMPVLAVLFVAVERLQEVADSLGPTVKDRLLVEVARRLDSFVRPQDLVARVGQAEFILLVYDIPEAEGVLNLARGLQQVLQQAFNVDGQDVFVNGCFGIARTDSESRHADEVLRDAETAMHHARMNNGTQIAIFDPSMHDHMVKRIRLEAELRHAVGRGELLAYYMPIVSLAGSGASPAGFEALVRWRHPSLGLVSPGEFIPLAEETGLIVDIDRWILRESCRQARIWLKTLPQTRPFYVSVNLSALDLQQPDLCEFIESALHETGLAASYLGLEVTESMMMAGGGSIHDSLSRLRGLGVKILIDDFGTGYSSLSYLHKLPFDLIKIDYAFVHRIGAEGENSEIVRTIVNLAKDLRKETVAEGTQTSEQTRIVAGLGCSYGQGPFFSWPVPEAEAGQLLSTHWDW